MFEDYQASVVKHYQLKRTDGSLSLNVMKPKPSTIRKECLFVLATRANKGDLLTLRLFVGERENEEEYGRAIRNTDVNIFKPLSNFLKGQTTNTEDKNIELLAWLIDFSPRPYKLGFTASDLMHIPLGTAEDDDQTQALSSKDTSNIYGGSGNIKVLTISPRKNLGEWLIEQFGNYRRKIIIGLVVLVTGAIGISLNKSAKNISFMPFAKNDNQCMYWNGDQYIQLACETKLPYTQVIALDLFKLDHFKKITRPDTLTEAHINKIWYLKTNNEVELYTCDGKHPEQPHRRLRPLSKYMFDKYVVGKKVRIN